MFTLDNVVPWGRSFDEYRQMFALSDADLGLRTLGCADGPAGFNAGATRRGGAVVSVDPLYRWDAGEIRGRIDATRERILDEARRNAAQFVWTSIRSVEELGRVRAAAMEDFLDDYPEGKAQGRYVDGALPALPFADASFELALCSHFLFLYSQQHDAAFHCAAIGEMCRVAGEARVFPLLALGGGPSPHVDPVTADLRARGYTISIEAVPYEFQRGGNEMLRARAPR
jgi:hypothetical protein